MKTTNESTTAANKMKKTSVKWPSAAVGLLLLISVATSASATTRIGNDMGGSLGKYLLRFTRFRRAGHNRRKLPFRLHPRNNNPKGENLRDSTRGAGLPRWLGG